MKRVSLPCANGGYLAALFPATSCFIIHFLKLQQRRSAGIFQQAVIFWIISRVGLVDLLARGSSALSFARFVLCGLSQADAGPTAVSVDELDASANQNLLN